MTQSTFLWFSGKGGTGKTTLSAATALQLGKRGHDVLVVSTDPAHSLSDALSMEIGETTSVTDNVDAAEIDPEEEVEDYKADLQMKEHKDQLNIMQDVYESMDIVKGGPGVAEMAAFNRFMEFMNTDEYDVVVFDTAPTGHTLSLLELPEIMDSMVGKILKMRMRFSQAIGTVKTIFGQGNDEDAELAKLERMKHRIENAREVMTDPSRTSFNFVMLAEQMSIYETERAIDRVNEYNIPIGRIFVNKLLPDNPDCQFCTSRREMQQDNLNNLPDTFDDYPIVHIPLQPDEVCGIDALHNLAAIMEEPG